MNIGLVLRQRTVAVLLASAVVLTACGGDDDTTDSSGDTAGTSGAGDSAGSESVAGTEEAVEITFLTNNDPANVANAESVARAFEAEHPNITVNVDTRPGGGEGDNLVKTRLSTGDMAEVFEYNSGSLFQAIAPTQNLQPVTDEPWIDDLDPAFTSVVSAEGDVYGAPFGFFTGGGIQYNIPLYEQLGLEVPQTWDEFMANNATILAEADGVAPVYQSFADTWTAQLFVLEDFYNVAQAEPGFAEAYTNNEAKFATTPAALAGFEHMQELHEAGYLNEDFASATYTDAVAAVALGTAAHYAMPTWTMGALEDAAPDNVDDVGFFAIPPEDAAITPGVTLWVPSGVYIPKGVEGAKLEAARAFLAFLASPAGCDAQIGESPVSGPFAVNACELPADVPRAIDDLTGYVDAGNASPGLEFLSPIKGPALEQILVEVGSGIRSAEDGAALYDQDVEKQAQQLGLEGW